MITTDWRYDVICPNGKSIETIVLHQYTKTQADEQTKYNSKRRNMDLKFFLLFLSHVE